MSRSTRHTPITGVTTAVSEKQDKRLANRSNRRLNHQVLDTTCDDTLLKPLRETSNVWDMDKDGKARFDANERPDLMRK